MDSQVLHFLDYFNPVEIKCEAAREERTRHQNQYVLRWKDEKNPRNMSIHDGF